MSIMASTDQQQILDKIYSKITWKILPFIFLMWLLAWIDRTNIGFAKLQMEQELAFFTAQVFGIGAGIFFLGYFFFEVPSNMLLMKIGTRKTIARITIGWGSVSILMMFTQSEWYFYLMRFLLGAFEAGFQPGVMLYLTFWFPANRRGKAFAYFISASAFSAVIGGPVAGAVMQGLHQVAGLSGWQWLFLLEGIPTVLCGIFALFYLCDAPKHAKWLTDKEKALLVEDLRQDEQKEAKRESSFLSAMKDGKIWVLTVIYFGIIAANSTLSFFSPTIVRGVGIEQPLMVGLSVGFIYIFGAFFQLTSGYFCDKLNDCRVPCALAAFIGAMGLTLVGLSIAFSLSPYVSFLGLIMAVSGTMGSIPAYWQMPNLFLAGGAAAISYAFINSLGNLAGFAAPYAMGAIKKSTDNYSIGLFLVALIEIAAVLLILAYIPSRRKREATQNTHLGDNMQIASVENT